MARRAHTIGCLAGLVLACVGAVAADRNFSQYPGFAEYFAENPPAGAAAPDDRALARRHAPRFHLPAGHEGPIDFYRDYIAHGYLVTGNGARIEGLTPVELNRHRDDALAEFVHVPSGESPRPAVYASIERTDLWAPRVAGSSGEKFTVLMYHLVFRVSGLPAGLPAPAEVSFALLADLGDWHQLDHYTAAFVVLDAAERPIALTLQQHNYLRTHLVGETVEPGRDGRFDIDIAIRSNELYPHVPERRSRRAVRFLSADATAFMMGYGTRPLMSADDITDPGPPRSTTSLRSCPAPMRSTRSRGFSAHDACCRAVTGRRARATTPCPGSSRCRRRSSAATGGSGTRATGRAIAAAASTAPTRPDSPARRHRCFHRNLGCLRRSKATAARCSSARRWRRRVSPVQRCHGHTEMGGERSRGSHSGCGSGTRGCGLTARAGYDPPALRGHPRARAVSSVGRASDF